MKLDAIVTTCTPTTRAMAAAATKTPIVMAAVSDPISQGLIASYRHPGGRISGAASQFEDMAAKMFSCYMRQRQMPSRLQCCSTRTIPSTKYFSATLRMPFSC